MPPEILLLLWVLIPILGMVAAFIPDGTFSKLSLPNVSAGLKKLSAKKETKKLDKPKEALPVGIYEVRRSAYSSGRKGRIVWLIQGFHDSGVSALIDQARRIPQQGSEGSSKSSEAARKPVAEQNFSQRLSSMVSARMAHGNEHNVLADDTPKRAWSELDPSEIDISGFISKKFAQVSDAQVLEDIMVDLDREHGADWGHRDLTAAEDHGTVLGSYFSGLSDYVAESIESRIIMGKARENALNSATKRRTEDRQQDMRTLETPLAFSRAMKQLEAGSEQ